MAIGKKVDGTLKKGFKYAKGGKVVKAKAATVKKKLESKPKAAAKSKTIKTTGGLSSMLKANGVRLPHGYQVVKRTTKKAATKKK